MCQQKTYFEEIENLTALKRGNIAPGASWSFNKVTVLDWVPIVLSMAIVWRRRWWRYIIGGLNKPVIFLAIFAWNMGGYRTDVSGSYLGFLVPGLLVMAAVSSSYGDLVGWFTLRRVYYRVLDVYLLAPISNTSLLIGHIIGAGTKGFFISGIVFLTSQFFVKGFHLTFNFFLQLFVVCLTFACLAVAMAMIAGGDTDAMMFTNLVVFPMTFFCGTFFPVENLPGILEQVSWCLPLTAATYNLRGLALTGISSLSWFAQSLGWLGAFYILAYYMLNKRRED
jgi:ABC-2 type transport system permease protein